MKLLRTALLLCLTLLMISPAAVAGNCKDIHANVGAIVDGYDASDCPDQEWLYDGCLLYSVKGTLNGDWWFYLYGWNAVEVLDPIEGHPGFWSGWSFSAFVTNKGELWTRDTWTADLEDTEFFDFSSQVSVIIGGTGVYEGATGRLGWIGLDATGVGRLVGHICTE